MKILQKLYWRNKVDEYTHEQIMKNWNRSIIRLQLQKGLEPGGRDPWKQLPA